MGAYSAPLRFHSGSTQDHSGSPQDHSGPLRTTQVPLRFHSGALRHTKLAFLIVDSLCDESRLYSSADALAATTEDRENEITLLAKRLGPDFNGCFPCGGAVSHSVVVLSHAHTCVRTLNRQPPRRIERWKRLGNGLLLVCSCS